MSILHKIAYCWFHISASVWRENCLCPNCLVIVQPRPNWSLRYLWYFRNWTIVTTVITLPSVVSISVRDDSWRSALPNNSCYVLVSICQFGQWASSSCGRSFFLLCVQMCFLASVFISNHFHFSLSMVLGTPETVLTASLTSFLAFNLHVPATFLLIDDNKMFFFSTQSRKVHSVLESLKIFFSFFFCQTHHRTPTFMVLITNLWAEIYAKSWLPEACCQFPIVWYSWSTHVFTSSYEFSKHIFLCSWIQGRFLVE